MSQIRKTWFADIPRDVDGNAALVTVLTAVSAARTKAIPPGLSREVTRQ